MSGLVTDHRDPRPLKLILFAQASSLSDLKPANALVHRIDSGEKQIGEGARVMLNGHAVVFVEDRRDAFDHGNFVAYVVDVGELETDFASRLGASSLQRRASGECSDHIDSPRTED